MIFQTLKFLVILVLESQTLRSEKILSLCDNFFILHNSRELIKMHDTNCWSGFVLKITRNIDQQLIN